MAGAPAAGSARLVGTRGPAARPHLARRGGRYDLQVEGGSPAMLVVE